jgi:hypothetical protein
MNMGALLYWAAFFVAEAASTYRTLLEALIEKGEEIEAVKDEMAALRKDILGG